MFVCFVGVIKELECIRRKKLQEILKECDHSYRQGTLEEPALPNRSAYATGSTPEPS